MSPSKNPATPVPNKATPVAKKASPQRSDATERTLTGQIMAVDPYGHKLVLSSGESLELSKSINANGFKQGQEVSVTCEMVHGKLTATKIKAVRAH